MQNIEDNSDYPDCEFVLLDYNSSDHLEEWVFNTLQYYLQSGKLIYYRTTDPQYFARSHSRNMAASLGKGDIICNVDADNFTGKGFAGFIDKCFREEENIFLTAHHIRKKMAIKSVQGRICARKKDFRAVGGYDERMISYGFEDLDLISRLENAGLKSIPIPSLHLKALDHEDAERVSNESTIHSLHKILVHYINPSATEMLLLFKNGLLSKGTVVNNFTMYADDFNRSLEPIPFNDEFSLQEGKWKDGKWINEDDNLLLQTNETHYRLQYSAGHYKDADKIYYTITDEELKIELASFYSQISNKLLMNENLVQGRIKVNQDTGYGKGRVFRNGNYTNLIMLY